LFYLRLLFVKIK